MKMALRQHWNGSKNVFDKHRGLESFGNKHGHR